MATNEAEMTEASRKALARHLRKSLEGREIQVAEGPFEKRLRSGGLIEVPEVPRSCFRALVSNLRANAFAFDEVFLGPAAKDSNHHHRKTEHSETS
jgi:hypothetical protein